MAPPHGKRRRVARPGSVTPGLGLNNKAGHPGRENASAPRASSPHPPYSQVGSHSTMPGHRYMITMHRITTSM